MPLSVTTAQPAFRAAATPLRMLGDCAGTADDNQEVAGRANISICLAKTFS